MLDFQNLKLDKSFQVRYDNNGFEVKIDVQQYAPEELNVTLQGNRLTITGKHEQKQDEHGYVSRQFHREFEVPEVREHFNPFLTNGFTHRYHLGEPIQILGGFSCDFKILFHFSMKFL